VNILNGVISRAERENEFRVSKFRVCWYNEKYKERKKEVNLVLKGYKVWLIKTAEADIIAVRRKM
jgi:hypothetical protein